VLEFNREEWELEKNCWEPVANHLQIDDAGSEAQILSDTALKPKGTIVALRWYTLAAASVVLAICSFIYLLDNKIAVTKKMAVKETIPSQQWKQVINDKNVSQRILLPDGSNVTLEPQSSIKFLSDFNKPVTREIYLDGEGFFEVTRNEQRPFLVHANKITTKVLGTSFIVKAFPQDKSVTVVVKTGKVSVYATQDKVNAKSETILTPNQQIVFDENQNKIARKIVEVPLPILPADEIKRMRFEDASIKEIFEAIEKIYGVELEFNEALYSSCTLTTTVSEGGLFNKLDIITSAIGAHYVLVEDKVVIKGTDCK
jgi:ferric-dicitrate binding protein FerR (iron transport regulator)